ncbi:MAG: DUF4190 domain-containing protein [Deltaproteobacteria bacterium]
MGATPHKLEPCGRELRRGEGTHASRLPAMRPCPACREPIHADSLICCVCGRLLPLRQEESVNPGAHSQPRSRKARASLILGCFSFLLLPGLAAVILGHLARAEIRRSRGALRGGRHAAAGLILGYLGLLATPALLAVSGLPGHLFSARVSQEDTALDSLRALNIAIQAYSATYHQGFPEKLSQLGPAASNSDPSDEASGFIAAQLASGQADEYRIRYRVTARDIKSFPCAYTITAEPDARAAGDGRRYFYTDQTQTIRFSRHRPSTSSSPVIEGEASSADLRP